MNNELQLSSNDYQDIACAFASFCHSDIYEMKLLLDNCNKYGVDYNDLLHKALVFFDLPIEVSSLATYLRYYAVGKLNSHVRKNINLYNTDYPSEYTAMVDGVTYCSERYMNYVSQLCRFDEAYTAILKDFVRVNKQ